MFRRSWIAASLLTIAGIGCHAGPPKNLAKTEAPISRSDVSAAKFIAKHNKNASTIQSLEAAPSVAFVGDHKGRADGHLALERNKNFRLELEYGLKHKAADIGSNEQEFWFWVKDDKEKAIYFCDHKNINASQLAVTLQPDWIMEAMGLREFTPDEASKVHTKQGETPGTIVLTQFRKDARGQTYTKETIVDEQTNEILEHKLYSGAKKELLANAVVTKNIYIKLDTPSHETQEVNNDPGGTPATQTIVHIPGNLRLDWVKENLSIEIAMSNTKTTKINPTFAMKRRVALFTEPTIPGTTRRDLAMLDPATSAASSRVYESRPIPKRGINLLSPQPLPLSEEGTVRRAIDPLPLSADLSSTPAQPAGVVGALIPSASNYN